CSDDKSFWVRMKCFPNQFFAHVRSIGICCVDEVDAELDCTAQDSDGFCSVGWLAPDVRTCELHRAETQPVNVKIVANRKRPAPCGRVLVGGGRRGVAGWAS